MLALIIAAVSGIAMAVQGSLNTALSKKVGVLFGTFIVQFTGTIFTIILLLFKLGSIKWQVLPQCLGTII